MGQVCLRLRPRLADDSWKILIITHKERNKHTNLNKSDITAETPQPQTEKRRLSLNPILRLGWRTWALRIEPQIHLKSLQKPIKIAFIFAEREIHIAEQRERGSRWRSMETVIIAMQCTRVRLQRGSRWEKAGERGWAAVTPLWKFGWHFPDPEKGSLGPGTGLEWSQGNYHLSARYQWLNGPALLHSTPLHSTLAAAFLLPLSWPLFHFQESACQFHSIPRIRPISSIKTLSRQLRLQRRVAARDRVDDHINGLAHDI